MIHINKYIYAHVHQVKFISLNSHFQPDHLFKLIKPNSTSYLQQSKPGATSQFRLHPAVCSCALCAYRMKISPSPAALPLPPASFAYCIKISPSPAALPLPRAFRHLCLPVSRFSPSPSQEWTRGTTIFAFQPTITLIMIRNSDKIK